MSYVLLTPWLNNQGVLLIPGVAPCPIHHVRCLCPLLRHMSKLILEVVFSKNGCRESQGIVENGGYIQRYTMYPFTSQSHAGAVVRFGTVLFGVVYVAHLSLELIAIIEEEPGWQFNTIRILLA